MTDTAGLIDQLGVDGPAAPPRTNGEFVFDLPWESRAFGMTLALAEDGLFTLADFQAELISAVAEWEALSEPSENYRYYECWLKALERLVDDKTQVRSPTSTNGPTNSWNAPPVMIMITGTMITTTSRAG